MEVKEIERNLIKKFRKDIWSKFIKAVNDFIYSVRIKIIFFLAIFFEILYNYLCQRRHEFVECKFVSPFFYFDF